MRAGRRPPRGRPAREGGTVPGWDRCPWASRPSRDPCRVPVSLRTKEHPMTPTSAAAPREPGCAPAQAEIHRAGRLPVDPRADARVAGPVPAVPAAGPLSRAQMVLAVTARPDQKSAELGGLLHAFGGTGASLALLCLTRGEASP